MRKKNIICFLLFLTLNSSLLTFNSFAQWVQQSVPVTGGYFNDMKFVNANTGFIAHYSYPVGTFLKTTNAGYNWTNNLNAQIQSISVVDSLNIYCTVNRGLYDKLLKTTNCGISWDSSLTTSNYLAYLYFFNKDTGIISGSNSFDNLIWRTTDGGQSIQLMSTISITGVGKFFFLKEKVNGEYYGYLYYPQDRYLYYTSNSGVSWQYRQFLPIAINSIYFVSKDTGWASVSSGVNYVMKTVDGGLNWVNQTVPYGTTTWDIYFANSQKGWIGCGSAQKIYATTNGGVNWGTQTIYGGASFILCFLDSLSGWAQTSYNTLSHTTNGGGSITSTISNDVIIQNDYKLFQNYPNPFNPSTIIKYKLNKPGIVSLKIYSVTGNEIVKIENSIKKAGYYEYSFTPKNLSSGVYIYKLEVFNPYYNLIYSESKKMIYVK